ncbi:hypothetical protein DH2020_016684 [Rehmannia glutinosa]|uniref:Uncharacterized protein n=1 Tax=Rehmannia glutinosa TaxID=99300 RepID=A0ABR0WS89_REHGL
MDETIVLFDASAYMLFEVSADSESQHFDGALAPDSGTAAEKDDFNDNTGEEEDDGGGTVDQENGAAEEVDGGGTVLAGLFWERPMGFVKGKMVKRNILIKN